MWKLNGRKKRFKTTMKKTETRTQWNNTAASTDGGWEGIAASPRERPLCGGGQYANVLRILRGQRFLH